MGLQSVDALLRRARERANRDDLAGARVDLDRVVELQPTSIQGRLARALFLVSSTEAVTAEDVAVARSDIGRAVELGGGARALAVRGWLALHVDHDPAAAERDLSAAIEAGDRRPSTYVARGWARDGLDDPAGAFADAARAAAFAPLDADARFLIGLSRIRLGDPGGAVDLDRAEASYIARGDLRGRRDVWALRRAVRERATPVPVRPGPWLWLGPGPMPGVVRVRGGHVPLVVAVAVIRYLVTTAVIVLAAAVLPGLTVGPPVVASLLVVSLLYRMLRAGAHALLESLRTVVPVPVGVVRWLQIGGTSSVAVARWMAAALPSSILFEVAVWASGWFRLNCVTSGVLPALAVGTVLGLGTFVSGPILRRSV